MAESARDVLDRRLAAGEITMEEHNRLLTHMGSQATSPARTGQAVGLPNSAGEYLPAWRKTDLALLATAFGSAFLTLRVLIPWILGTEWGQRFFDWLASIAEAALGNDAVASFGTAVGVTGIVISMTLARTVGSVVILGFLHARDIAAVDLPADLRAAIAARNRSWLSLAKVEVVALSRGIMLEPHVRRGYGLLAFAAFFLVVWAL